MELKILSLMMQLELNDMMFFIRCLKEPTEAFSSLRPRPSSLRVFNCAWAENVEETSRGDSYIDRRSRAPRRLRQYVSYKYVNDSAYQTLPYRLTG